MIFWILALAGFLFAASRIVDYQAQWVLGGALLLALFVIRLAGGSLTGRTIFLMVGVFIVLRYLFWRTTQTLEFFDWVSFGAAMTLYLAEVYGILIFLLGIFVNIRPFQRDPVGLPPEDQLPTVDVFIPSYDESEEILEVTAIAAQQMDYPADKLSIYLLDDGGTDQKCRSGSEEQRRAASDRREKLAALCQRLGITYLTRERNEKAKAGNINEAMKKTHGEVIAIFDADHVPTRDFLQHTVGYFRKDPKLFLVQTPHFFVNPDPIEKNLGTFESAPSENEMFYRVVQPGLDYWNASFFCGSGALLRRKHLEEVGGVCGDSITEDAETALSLHAKGYRSAFVSKPLLSGLAPETMGGFIAQRIRWATGMIQIFILKNPIFKRGLTLPQRICYTNSCSFWFFPFARLVFLIAPIFFLVFGLRIYATNWQSFTAYAIPHLVAVLAVSSYLYGRHRRAFVSELYELIQSVYCIPAIIKTVFRPRAPAFKVTPKGEFLDETFISPLSLPFYLLTVVNLIALVFGFARHLSGAPDMAATSITMGFAFFNLTILLAALGALLERRQRRASPRMPEFREAVLEVGDRKIDCRLQDLSLGGCSILVDSHESSAIEGIGSGILHATSPEGKKTALRIALRSTRYDDSYGMQAIGVQFQPKDFEERRAQIAFSRGNSDRWMNFQRNRESQLGVLGCFIVMVALGIRHSTAHLLFLIRNFFTVLTGGRSRARSQAA